MDHRVIRVDHRVIQVDRSPIQVRPLRWIPPPAGDRLGAMAARPWVCPCTAAAGATAPERPTQIGGAGDAFARSPSWWLARKNARARVALVGRGGSDPLDSPGLPASTTIGLFSGPDDFLARVASVDSRWNALAEQVCGSLRSAQCNGPAALELGSQWTSAFRAALESWRNERDAWRESMFPGFWASVGSDSATLERFEAELAAFAADVQRVTGEASAPAPVQPAGPLDDAARTLGEAISSAALPIGLGLAALAVIAVSRR